MDEHGLHWVEWVSPFMRRKMKKVCNKIVRFGAYLSTVNSLGSLPQKLDFLNCNAVFQLNMGILYHFNPFQISLNFHSRLELGTHATPFYGPMSSHVALGRPGWTPGIAASLKTTGPGSTTATASGWGFPDLPLQLSRKEATCDLAFWRNRYWMMYRLYTHTHTLDAT